MIKLMVGAIMASTLSIAGLGLAHAEDVVRLPNFAYRTGPFSSMGIPLMNGQRDYIAMINERDGGINGVKLGYEECETALTMEKGIECYDKTKADAIVAQPGSLAISLALMPKSSSDKIPLIAPGYGLSATADGRTFPWAFNPPVTSLDGVSMMFGAISDRDLDDLRGKKIALLYLDAPYGEEPIPLMQRLADSHGFTLLPVPVGVKEMQSQAVQWQRIVDEKPDFVLLWGLGAMNGSALAEAAKTGFPMQKLIGMWWSGNDGDLRNLGDAAKGYRALSWNLPVSNAPAMQDIRKYVLDRKKTEIGAGTFDWVLYQRGVLISMFTVEAIKAAQANFNSRIVSAEQLRWGFENLKIDEARLAAIGMAGMVAPFSTSCADHSGHAGAWMLEWNGTRFVKASDLLSADRDVIGPMIEVEARKYAKAHEPWPDNEECRP